MTQYSTLMNEFLLESNAIEGVYDKQSFEDAKAAWKIIKDKKYISMKTLLKAHAALMRIQSIPDKYKGSLRDCPVWVGGRRCREAHELQDAMTDYLDRLRSSQIIHNPFTLEHALMYHVQFEHIHPFIDGNGRIGRLLFAWHCRVNKIPLHIFRNKDKHEKYYPLFNYVSS